MRHLLLNSYIGKRSYTHTEGDGSGYKEVHVVTYSHDSSVLVKEKDLLSMRSLQVDQPLPLFCLGNGV